MLGSTTDGPHDHLISVWRAGSRRVGPAPGSTQRYGEHPDADGSEIERHDCVELGKESETGDHRECRQHAESYHRGPPASHRYDRGGGEGCEGHDNSGPENNQRHHDHELR